MRWPVFFKWPLLGGWLFLMVFAAYQMEACSIRWSEPHNRYSGINERGVCELFYTVGFLPLEDEKPLPLILSFSPVYPPSRFFSSNFNLFIFDARMYPLSEREYECIYPDGWTYHYWASKDKNILNGSSGWKAEISKNAAGNLGNIINLFANCGGWRMTFTGGRITTIKTPKNKLIDVVMLGDKAGEIRVNGSTALRIQMDAREGRSGEMIFKDGKRNKFELGSKSLVLVGADKKREIKGEELSLRRMTLADGTVMDYVFGVDESKQPTLKVSSTGKDEHLYTWDASSRYLLSDAVCGTAETNTWQYVVKPGATPQDNAACIEKRDAKGELVSAWKATPGREETFENGVWTIRTWFVNAGKLSGRTRKIEQRTKDNLTLIYQASFDGNAKLIREFSDGVAKKYVYNGNGDIVEILSGDRLLCKKQYDGRRRIVLEEWMETKKTIRYCYPDSAQWRDFIGRLKSNPNDVQFIKLEYAGSRLDKQIFYVQNNEIRAQTDALGHFVECVRNKSGETNWVDGRLDSKCFYDERGKKVRQESYLADGKTMAYIQRYKYDGNDLNTEILVENLLDQTSYKIIQVYDAQGRIVEWIDKSGVYHYQYDERGERTQTYEAKLVPPTGT
ncbi:MAG: RHS repeat protein [Verrucomicrobiae bacterium]|nr:RHS repeat protein [Verrucomicrobiae bacterium]